MKYKNTLLIVLSLIVTSNSHAGLLYNYSQLALKDLDQMNQLVVDRVKESKKSASGKAVPLKEALQAVYARPNEDEMIEKVVSPLRAALDDLEAWEKTLSQLTDEAVNALKNPKAFKPVVQTTYVVFLENLLSEIKPYIKNDGYEKALAIRIRDAKIEVSKEAVNERKVRTMKPTTSPSVIAEQIIAGAGTVQKGNTPKTDSHKEGTKTESPQKETTFEDDIPTE